MVFQSWKSHDAADRIIKRNYDTYVTLFNCDVYYMGISTLLFWLRNL